MSRRGRQGFPFVVGQFIARPLLARNVRLALEEQHCLAVKVASIGPDVSALKERYVVSPHIALRWSARTLPSVFL